MKKRFLGGPGRTELPLSTLSVSRPGMGIQIRVRSTLSKRHRRQVILALFRSAKLVLADLDGSDVYHSDSGVLSGSATLGRPVSLHQSLGVTTSARAEGLNIRLRRLALHLTQAEFATSAGLSRTHLSRIEHGRTEIEALTRERIAFALRLALRRNRNAQLATARARVSRAVVSPGSRVYVRTTRLAV